LSFDSYRPSWGKEDEVETIYLAFDENGDLVPDRKDGLLTSFAMRKGEGIKWLNRKIGYYCNISDPRFYVTFSTIGWKNRTLEYRKMRRELIKGALPLLRKQQQRQRQAREALNAERPAQEGPSSERPAQEVFSAERVPQKPAAVEITISVPSRPLSVVSVAPTVGEDQNTSDTWQEETTSVPKPEERIEIALAGLKQNVQDVQDILNLTIASNLKKKLEDLDKRTEDIETIMGRMKSLDKKLDQLLELLSGRDGPRD